MHAWTSYASSSRGFYYGGTTSAIDSCDFGFTTPHITAATGGICAPRCPTTCNCAQAVYQPCFSGWYIALNTRNFSWSLSPTSTSTEDVQGGITHELGHAAGLDHTDVAGTNCVMQTAGTLTVKDRYFCRTELLGGLQSIDTVMGRAQEDTYSTRNYGWPTPGVSNWAGLQPSYPFGWGFGTAERGIVSPSYVRDSMFLSTNTATVQTTDYTDPYPGTLYPSPVTTVRRPGSAFDPTRNQWWLFTLNGTNVPQIVVSTTLDRITWTFWGSLAYLGGNGAGTRSPVVATYDSLSDSSLSCSITIRIARQFTRRQRSLAVPRLGVPAIMT